MKIRDIDPNKDYYSNQQREVLKLGLEMEVTLDRVRDRVQYEIARLDEMGIDLDYWEIGYREAMKDILKELNEHR